MHTPPTTPQPRYETTPPPPSSANSLLGGGIPPPSPTRNVPPIPNIANEQADENEVKFYDEVNSYIAENLCLFASNVETSGENIINNDMKSFMQRLEIKNDILDAVILQQPFYVQYDKSQYITYYVKRSNDYCKEDIWNFLKSRLMYMFVEKLICEGSQGFDKKSENGLINLALKILHKNDVKKCLLIDFCSNKKVKLNQGSFHLVKTQKQITNLSEAIESENAYCIYKEILKIMQTAATDEEHADSDDDIGIIDAASVLRTIAEHVHRNISDGAGKKESIGVIAFAMLIFQIFLSAPIQSKLIKPDKFQEPVVDTDFQINFNSTVPVCKHTPHRKREFDHLSKATEDDTNAIVNYTGDVPYSELTISPKFNLYESKCASSPSFIVFKKLPNEQPLDCGDVPPGLARKKIRAKKLEMMNTAQQKRIYEHRENTIDRIIKHKFGTDHITDLIVMTSLRLCVTTKLDLLLSSHDRQTTSINLKKYKCLTDDRASHHYILKGVGFGIINDIKYSSYGLIPSTPPTFHQWSSYDFSLFYIAKEFKNSSQYVKFILAANTKLEQYIGPGNLFFIDDWDMNHPMPTLGNNGLCGAGKQFNVITNLNTYSDTVPKNGSNSQAKRLSSKADEIQATQKITGGLSFSHEYLYFRVVGTGQENKEKKMGGLRDVSKIQGGFPLINKPANHYRESSDGPNGGAYKLFRNARNTKDFMDRSKLQRLVMYSMFGVDPYHANISNKNTFDPPCGFSKTCVDTSLSIFNIHPDNSLVEDKNGGFSTKAYHAIEKYQNKEKYLSSYLNGAVNRALKDAPDRRHMNIEDIKNEAIYGTSGMSFFLNEDIQTSPKKEAIAFNVPRIVALCGGPLAIGLLMNDTNTDFRSYPFKGGEITMLNQDSSAFLKFETWNTCKYLHSSLLLKLIGVDMSQGTCMIKHLKTRMSSYGKYVSGFTEITDPEKVKLKVKRRDHFLTLRLTAQAQGYGDCEHDSDDDDNDDNDENDLRAQSPALHDSLDDTIAKMYTPPTTPRP
tara:strand:- start:728 stop:3775 length:3048 start_codon:yes stop_codon:yes gene_type:complete